MSWKDADQTRAISNSLIGLIGVIRTNIVLIWRLIVRLTSPFTWGGELKSDDYCALTAGLS